MDKSQNNADRPSLSLKAQWGLAAAFGIPGVLAWYILQSHLPSEGDNLHVVLPLGFFATVFRLIGGLYVAVIIWNHVSNVMTPSARRSFHRAMLDAKPVAFKITVVTIAVLVMRFAYELWNYNLLYASAIVAFPLAVLAVIACVYVPFRRDTAIWLKTLTVLLLLVLLYICFQLLWFWGIVMFFEAFDAGLN